MSPQPPIALICYLFPSSPSSHSQLTSTLTSLIPYYLSPSSLCTTWTYFTPNPNPKSPFLALSPTFSKTTKDLVVGGVEIYTDKEGLSRQMEKQWFKEVARKGKESGWYKFEEEMRVWWVVGGYVSRVGREMSSDAVKGGKKVVVMLAQFETKEGKREEAVEILSKFASWVQNNEPATLTYSVLVHPPKKSSNAVTMFERYQDTKALGIHGGGKEFKAMFKQLAPLIHTKQTKMAQWEEMEASFVGKEVGKEGEGGEVVLGGGKAKL